LWFRTDDKADGRSIPITASDSPNSAQKTMSDSITVCIVGLFMIAQQVSIVVGITATLILTMIDLCFWSLSMQGIIPARWWVLISAAVGSLPFDSFESKAGMAFMFIGLQTSVISIFTAVLFSLGFNHSSETLSTFLHWLNVESLILSSI
jgi:hypothetical protein